MKIGGAFYEAVFPDEIDAEEDQKQAGCRKQSFLDGRVPRGRRRGAETQSPTTRET